MTPEERREQQRSNRAYLKSRARCVHCGKQDERTTAGRVLCAACAAYNNAYAKRRRAARTPEQRERQNAMRRARRAERVAAGVCSSCGGALDRAGRVCAKCLKKNSRFRKDAAHQAENRARLRSQKRCVCCGAQDARTEAGRRLCEACGRKQAGYNKRRRACLKGQGRCTQCGNRDARTEAGQTLCEQCAETGRQRMREYQQRRRME